MVPKQKKSGSSGLGTPDIVSNRNYPLSSERGGDVLSQLVVILSYRGDFFCTPWCPLRGKQGAKLHHAKLPRPRKSSSRGAPPICYSRPAPPKTCKFASHASECPMTYDRQRSRHIYCTTSDMTKIEWRRRKRARMTTRAAPNKKKKNKLSYVRHPRERPRSTISPFVQLNQMDNCCASRN